MANCNSCNRRIDHSRDEKTGIRKRTRDHVCPTVVIQCKKKNPANEIQEIKTVHEDRVAKGGDLHKLVTGRNAPWEVVFRNRAKIEKIAENRKSKKAKKTNKKLEPKKGEVLQPAKG